MSNIQFYNGEYLQTWTDSQTTVRFMPSDEQISAPDCQGPDCSEKGTYGYVEHEGRKLDLCEKHWGEWAGKGGWSDAGRYGEEQT